MLDGIDSELLQVASWSQRGTCTPDHVIRTKAFPLLLLQWPVLENAAKPTEKGTHRSLKDLLLLLLLLLLAFNSRGLHRHKGSI